MAGRRGRRDKPRREQRKVGNGFPLKQGQIVLVSGQKSQKAMVLRQAKSGNRVVVRKMEKHKKSLSRKDAAQMDKDRKRAKELYQNLVSVGLTSQEENELNYLWRRMGDKFVSRVVRLPQVTTIKLNQAVLPAPLSKPRYVDVPQSERRKARAREINRQLYVKYRKNPKRMLRELKKRLGRIPKRINR